jgi:hypothetical protein
VNLVLESFRIVSVIVINLILMIVVFLVQVG